MHLQAGLFGLVGLVAAVSSPLNQPATAGREVATSVAEWRAQTENCKWCGDWAMTPTSPYSAHQFTGGGAEDDNASADGFGGHALSTTGGPRSFDDRLLATSSLELTSAFAPGIRREGQWYLDCAAFNSCHSNIQDGACTSWHDSCRFGDDLTARLQDAMRSESTEELRELITESEGSIKVVSRRGVVQVHDCRGYLVAQYSISDALASSLGRN